MKSLQHFLALAALAGFVTAAQTLDVTSQAAILAAAKAATPYLKKHFDGNVGGVVNNNGIGAWLEQYGDKRYVVQWHESGMYWDLFYTYYSYTGDGQYNAWVDKNVQLSLGDYNGQMGFLDQMSAISGRWNDDIGWWGIAMISAAEGSIGGIVAPGDISEGHNPKYVDVGSATHSQMFENWETGCGGGIFWARDRSAKKESDRYYKSAITNAQHVEMSARLMVLTGDKKYQTSFDQVYDWTMTHLADQATYAVYDGLDNRSCMKDSKQYSYYSGELLAGLATMYKATQTQKYLDEANKHFLHISSVFTRNSVLYDPQCDLEKCKQPTGFLWAIYKSFSVFYEVASADNKAQITSIMQASANDVFKNCDSDWNCIRQLSADTDFTLWDGTNVRDQFETVAMLNSLAIMSGAKITQRKQDTTPGPATPAASSKMEDTGSNTLMYAGIGGGVGLLILIAAISVCYSRGKKRSKEQREHELSRRIHDDATLNRARVGRNEDLQAGSQMNVQRNGSLKHDASLHEQTWQKEYDQRPPQQYQPQQFQYQQQQQQQFQPQQPYGQQQFQPQTFQGQQFQGQQYHQPPPQFQGQTQQFQQPPPPQQAQQPYQEYAYAPRG
ncbi:glycosyl hydrolase family 76-domain-containing protein [Chytriomyces cf. hyalinus JEL632]|nr:glycosyl hydrolase family 76-domain-containing protein [Chytriomyces cf. hyalinus JEL632]